MNEASGNPGSGLAVGGISYRYLPVDPVVTNHLYPWSSQFWSSGCHLRRSPPKRGQIHRHCCNKNDDAGSQIFSHRMTIIKPKRRDRKRCRWFDSGKTKACLGKPIRMVSRIRKRPLVMLRISHMKKPYQSDFLFHHTSWPAHLDHRQRAVHPTPSPHSKDRTCRANNQLEYFLCLK